MGTEVDAMAHDISKKDMQKENFKMGLQVFLRTILSAILSFFVYMSLTMMASGLSTHEIGYEIYERNSSGEMISIRTHLYENDSSAPAPTQTPAGPDAAPGANTTTAGSGTGTTASQTAAETLPTNQQKVALRSEEPVGVRIAVDILSSICMLLILAAFPYSIVWSKGDRDKNSVNFGHMQEDKLRGLKVGLISAVPAGIAYVVLLVSKIFDVLPGYVFLYRLGNVPFLPFLNAIIPDTVKTTAQVPWGSIAAMLVCVIFVPAICCLAYFLGYKQISLTEKFIYTNPDKKKKRRRW